MTDPSYPIGKFERQSSYSSAERAELIQALRQLPEQMRQAVAGLTEAQLETPYRQGGWTVRQVVHHVPDSHLNAYVRFKLALTEDNPTIKPYNESAWARLPDSSLPLEVSLALLEALHWRWVSLLQTLPETVWHRTFLHPASGEFRLETSLALYAWHSKHHLAHILTLRQQQNW